MAKTKLEKFADDHDLPKYSIFYNDEYVSYADTLDELKGELDELASQIEEDEPNVIAVYTLTKALTVEPRRAVEVK